MNDTILKFVVRLDDEGFGIDINAQLTTSQSVEPYGHVTVSKGGALERTYLEHCGKISIFVLIVNQTVVYNVFCNAIRCVFNRVTFGIGHGVDIRLYGLIGRGKASVI